jgi:hypothetical protein
VASEKFATNTGSFVLLAAQVGNFFTNNNWTRGCESEQGGGGAVGTPWALCPYASVCH